MHSSVFLNLQSFAKTITENFSANVSAHPEDQLKHPAIIFLQSFGRDIIVRTEVVHTDVAGRPDLGVTVNRLLAGFVELKAPGLGADPNKLKGDQNKKQWKNFQSIPNLIYTDGNQWALFRSGEKIGKTVVLDDDITKKGEKAVTEENANKLSDLLLDFLSWNPIVPKNPKELAKYLAPLTRFLREEVELSLKDENSALSLLANEWRNYLFPEVDSHQFADAYAQTLTYALLLARISGAEDLSPEAASIVLDKGNGLLATTLKILAQKGARDDVSTGYDMLVRCLSAIDPEEILKRAPHLWLYFYEDFLSAYDKQLRNDYGVYYTPVEVVQCQIKLISELLKTTFDKKLSFADDEVTFLDPAVGTGTYLVSAIQHALSIVRERSGQGAVAGRASVLAKNMFAFEFLVGPYAVAHLRLTQEILSEGGNLPDGRLQIYLADTLESPFTTPPGALDLTHKKLVEERQHARDVKEKQNILICLGNPPYNRQNIEQGDTETHRKGGWVRYGDEGQNQRIFEDFLRPARQAGHAIHLKNLYNDYVYFWRWALWKLFEHQNSGGIISFITASSYLSGPGFVGMRETMRRTFDKLWIINLEGDNLGARKTENVFNIQTPVAIAIGFCKDRPKRDVPADVYYTKITGTREKKLQILDTIQTFANLEWEQCPNGWLDRFLPGGTGDFFSWPSLSDLFPWQHSGAQFKRRWPIGETIEELEEKWKTFLGFDTKERRDAFYETRDRQIDKIYQNAMPGSNEKSLKDLPADTPMPQFIRYAFRSFDRQWAIFDTRLGDYLKPDLYSVHGDYQIYMNGLLSYSLGKGPSTVATSLIPDMHHFRGSFGGGDVIPLFRDRNAQNPNITKNLLDFLSVNLNKTVSPEDLFSYCYSVLAHPSYVEMFWEELSIPGPRIPITKNFNLFQMAVDLGRKLIWLHTYGERLGNERNGEIPIGLAKCLIAIPDTRLDYPEEIIYDLPSKEIRFGKGVFGPVSEEIWEFEVSGFKVVHSWLAYRRKSGSGKRSSILDEIRPHRWTAQMTDEFLELLWILEHTISLFPDLKKLLMNIISEPCFLASDLPKPTDQEREPPKTIVTMPKDDRQQSLF